MSDADKLFEELGYEKIKQDVIYEGFWEEYYNADMDKTISFNLTDKIVGITDDEGWGITMQELKAINAKVNEEEKKAIDYLQFCYDISTIDSESLPKLGIVLNLIDKLQKELNQEKESHKLDNENYKILHDDVTALAKYMGLEENAIIDEMYEAFDKEKEKNKKLEKVIDMLIEDIVEYHIPADFCMQYGKYKQNCKTLDDNEKCKECIREYYFKKARGEEDEQM